MKKSKKFLSIVLALALAFAPIASATMLPDDDDWDLNANVLILDLDGDTTITADTDDTIDFDIAGSNEFVLTATVGTFASDVTLTSGNLLVTAGTVTATAGNVVVTAGDAVLTAGRLLGGVSSNLTCSTGLVIDLSVTKESYIVTIGEAGANCAISFTNGTAGEVLYLSHSYLGTRVVTFADVAGWDGAWTPVVAECTGTDAAITAANSDFFYISGVMTSGTEIAITGCNYFDAA